MNASFSAISSVHIPTHLCDMRVCAAWALREDEHTYGAGRRAGAWNRAVDSNKRKGAKSGNDEEKWRTRTSVRAQRLIRLPNIYPKHKCAFVLRIEYELKHFSHWIEFRMHSVWALFYFDLILKRKYKYLVNFAPFCRCHYCCWRAGGRFGIANVLRSIVHRCWLQHVCQKRMAREKKRHTQGIRLHRYTLPNSREIIKMNVSVVNCRNEFCAVVARIICRFCYYWYSTCHPPLPSLHLIRICFGEWAQSAYDTRDVLHSCRFRSFLLAYCLCCCCYCCWCCVTVLRFRNGMRARLTWINHISNNVHMCE